MPVGKEQLVVEIMRLALREAEREIGLAELARVRRLGDHVRNHPFPQGPGQRGGQLPLRLGLGRGDHVEDRLVGFHHVAAFFGAQHRQQRSEEHTSELQSLMRISYAVFCLKKKKTHKNKHSKRQHKKLEVNIRTNTATININTKTQHVTTYNM